jgi:hypothetical protein
MLVGFLHRPELDLVEPRQDEFGARRHFEGGHDGARDEFGIAGMAMMARRVDGLHDAALLNAESRPVSTTERPDAGW